METVSNVKGSSENEMFRACLVGIRNDENELLYFVVCGWVTSKCGKKCKSANQTVSYIGNQHNLTMHKTL